MPAPARPQPGAGPDFEERLTPAPWVWGALLPVAASGGLVVLTAFGGRVALLVAAACVAAAVWGLLRSSAVVRVADGELAAGRAHVPLRLLGAVRELDAEQTARLRGPGADARAHLCQRGWIATAVAVEIADPADPTPYWLISSRRPAELAATLRRAGARPGP